MDYGAEALSDTLNAARASGIATIGAGMTLGSASRRVLIEAGGLRIAFLGYSDVNPVGFVATPGSPGTAKADVEAIAHAVRAAKRAADLVVCWFHWGVELERSPNERQQQFAAAALQAGAKVVLGAHPHVLGAVERRARHSIVAWTLGNFVFPSGQPATLQTAILRVTSPRRVSSASSDPGNRRSSSGACSLERITAERRCNAPDRRERSMLFPCDKEDAQCLSCS